MKNNQIGRRGFLRVVGGAGVLSATAPGYIMGSERLSSEASSAAEGVLVEASQFDDLGGWKLDTQHYQQMGGCYLLAHGMGKPVANASTHVALPAAGTWHVWVRTRDWCQGEWKSPGRFNVSVNDKKLTPEFGTEDTKWHWQKGGAIQIDDPAKVKIKLADLTGFDGRCDAVYFSKSSSPTLPNDAAEVVAWKDQLTGRAELEVNELEFDLVVVGGGISGCGAALAARSQGLKVALIQDRPIFGGNASEEVRVHTLGIHGRAAGILKKIDTEHYPNGSALARKDQKKREAAMAASGVELFAGHIACGLSKNDGRIESVEAREASSGRLQRFYAPVFVDATGDGWLGYWAGAEYRIGRESHTEFGEAWDKHGDLWSPEIPDKRVMGTSVLWNAEKTNQRSTFPDVPWAMPVAKDHEATAGEWYWEYSNNDLDQIDDSETIRDHMLRAIYGSFANAKRHPKNAPWTLEWVSFVGGKRESRRLMGDHIYTMKDAAERREFEDAVVVETREIDSHYQQVLQGNPVDFLSKALFYKTGGEYFVPFRSLYSKDIDNLMMAGRCFSCSHIGLAGPRVMNTCGQMGVATGYAASLCKAYQTTPREVGQKHVRELRSLIGFEDRSS
ncbi:FAD-dependent oxidoreductase [Rhodopirellula europaea]|uniref:Pyridine nucleotide-disulfide oxidoreductase n=1 Tax=Rhodopirellula europaea 6C TaxID=1263867 RepID=M2A9F0_9BACT|nr:FAD-dependent oxidoreductase [Rhodopirellula europaea]EMB18791.1 pyridine nucleotide-disulfide oxidoreductase [Rhodopirellula europaea 6C]